MKCRNGVKHFNILLSHFINPVTIHDGRYIEEASISIKSMSAFETNVLD